MSGLAECQIRTMITTRIQSVSQNPYKKYLRVVAGRYFIVVEVCVFMAGVCSLGL